jgi:hypothetical protein
MNEILVVFIIFAMMFLTVFIPYIICELLISSDEPKFPPIYEIKEFSLKRKNAK